MGQNISIDSLRDISEHIAVVLVQTSHPANIGSAARAMKTMGISHLRLVKPVDFPSARAQWLAAGAEDLLDKAIVFETFEQAVADCQLIVGTSARLRGLPWPHVPPLEAAGSIISHAQSKMQCGLVFGREASGLTNDELQACHLHTLIPGNSEYSVLNIAQAVQVLCYEIRTQWLLQTEEYRSLSVLPDGKRNLLRSYLEYSVIPWEEPLARHDQIDGLFSHLQASLTRVGFLTEFNHGKIWPRLLRMFQKQRLDAKETALLRGLCSHLDKMSLKVDDLKD